MRLRGDELENEPAADDEAEALCRAIWKARLWAVMLSGEGAAEAWSRHRELLGDLKALGRPIPDELQARYLQGGDL